MRRITLTTTDASGGTTTSSVAMLDQYISPFNVTINVIVTGTVTYTVQYTTSDIFGGVTPVWINSTDSNVVAATSTQTSNMVIPVTAIRIRQTAGAGSTLTNVLQAGITT